MKNFNPHKNSQKRFYDPSHIYFLTTNTYKRFPFFREDIFCELFIDNLRICKKLKEFRLYGFVIIPCHVHLLIKAGEKFNISQIMQSLKQNVSCDINRIINYIEGERPASRLHDARCLSKNKLHKIYKNKNININEYINHFSCKYGRPQYQIPPFKWHQSFHDHVIRNEADFLQHLNYVYTNPVKHNVCDDEKKYKWSFMNPELRDLMDDYFE